MIVRHRALFFADYVRVQPPALRDTVVNGSASCDGARRGEFLAI
ncbi:MAG TPA: hypothetical protein VMV87_20835 [Burkholderiales bacterium]|nr:hypothetical protein [Burkholderiales bacterium]